MSPRSPLHPLAAAALLILVAAIPEARPADIPSAREMLRSYFEDCLNDPGDFACLAEYWTAEKAERVAQSEGVRRWAFPDLEYEILDILVDGERAAVRCRTTGHPAPSAVPEGGEATPLELEEAFFYRVRDGEILSGTVISDRMAVANAMGRSGNTASGSNP